MVVTRQSNHRDEGETGEDSNFQSPPNINQAAMDFQPPLSFVFQPLNQTNNAEEFDIAEDTDSVQCDSEMKDTASEITDMVRRSDESPSRGGSEVVRLLASLHDLSRQMEVTMVDLRAQLGGQLGNQSWPAGDYDLPDATSPRGSGATQRIQRIKTVATHTWRGVVSRLWLLGHVICQRFPVATARLAEVFRKLRPILPALGYLLLVHVAYGVYGTHRRLVEQQKRLAVPWL